MRYTFDIYQWVEASVKHGKLEVEPWIEWIKKPKGINLIAGGDISIETKSVVKGLTLALLEHPKVLFIKNPNDEIGTFFYKGDRRNILKLVCLQFEYPLNLTYLAAVIDSYAPDGCFLLVRLIDTKSYSDIVDFDFYVVGKSQINLYNAVRKHLIDSFLEDNI